MRVFDTQTSEASRCDSLDSRSRLLLRLQPRSHISRSHAASLNLREPKNHDPL